MSIPAKAAGTLSLISTVHDIHKTSLIIAEQHRQKACANSFISTSVGTQKTNFLSYKDAKRNNWFMQNSAVFSSPNEFWASIKGYFKGVHYGLTRYLPKIIFSALSIIPSKNMKIFAENGILANKHNIIANVCAAILGIMEVSDYLVNGTNLNKRTDYLNLK